MRLPRAIAAAALAVLCGIGAWVLLQHGISTDAFPPFIDGAESTSITRYSGPWLTAAAGAGLLAALLLLAAVVELLRGSGRAVRAAG